MATQGYKDLQTAFSYLQTWYSHDIFYSISATASNAQPVIPTQH